MKTLEYMLQKGGLKMSAENVLKQLGKVKYVVATNPKGGRHNVEIVHYSINGTKGNYG